MYTFDELVERYTDKPRRMDAYLRKLTHTETGQDSPFPTLKLLVVTALTIGGVIVYSQQTNTPIQTVGMIALALYMGVAIQIVRAASQTEKNVKLIGRADLSAARVYWADSHLFQLGSESGDAVIIFNPDAATAHDHGHLKAVAKRVRAAVEGEDGSATEDIRALINDHGYGAAPLPETLAGGANNWLARIQVNPERLPDGRIRDQRLVVLSVPGENFVAQL
ncbi:MAG: hypothetical protein ACON3Z_17845 [Bradymonadia bacterium]